MIHESWPWRVQLLRDADIIERWSGKPIVSEQRSFILEKKVFLAAYSIRKLLQARKLSSSFSKKAIKCKTFPALDKHRVTPWNAYKWDSLYDFSGPRKEEIKAQALLDTIIHSLVFVEMIRRDNTVSGFLVTSDYRRSALWQLSVRQFLSLMRNVANDQPSSAYRIRAGDTEEWQEWRGHSRNPLKSYRAALKKNA